jgi:hypothetical protein
VGMNHLPMKMEYIGCSETSEHKIQASGNYPEESIQRSLLLHTSLLASKQRSGNALSTEDDPLRMVIQK